MKSKAFYIIFLILSILSNSIYSQNKDTSHPWLIDGKNDTLEIKEGDTVIISGDIQSADLFFKYQTRNETKKFKKSDSLSYYIIFDKTEIESFGPAEYFEISADVERANKNESLFVIIKLSKPSIGKLPELPTGLLPSEYLNTKSTSIIEDAYFIRANLNEDPDKVRNLLGNYYNVTNAQGLKGNPFLSKVINSDFFNRFISQQSKTQKSASLKNLGSIDVTKYADGLSRFLVKRVKEELTIEFFQQFYDAINKPELKDFGTLFPSTKKSLLLVGEEVYKYQKYLSQLRESFSSDLHLLPEHFETVINENHQEYFNENPNLKNILLIGFNITKGIRDKRHPGYIISGFSFNEFRDTTSRATLNTIQYFSESLKDTDPENTENYWVKRSMISHLLDDSITRNLFIGLLIETKEAKEIQYQLKNEHSTLRQLVIRNSSKIIQFLSNLETTAYHAETIEDIIKYYKQNNDRFQEKDLIKFTQATNKIIQALYNSAIIFRPEIENKPVSKIVSIIDNTTNLYTNVKVEKFSSSIFYTTELYQDLVEVFQLGGQKETEKKNTGVQDNTNKVANMPNENPGQDTKGKGNKRVTKKGEKNKKKEKPPLNKEVDNAERVLTLIKKYGYFIASMVEAEDAVQVAELIEAYALPSGSARIKRFSKFNISLNGYLGPYFGAEYMKEKEPIYLAGLSTPVGVGLNWGFLPKKSKEKKKGIGSISAFFSLIDIGAITEFRFNDDNSDLAKVYLKEIFSPGAFISLGISDKPFSINLGIQQRALLNESSATGNQVLTRKSYLASCSFVVDIPILNFHTVPKKLRKPKKK